MTDPGETPRAAGLGRAVQAGLSGEAMSASGVLAAIGGVRGIIESLLPATIYLIVFVITRDARFSALAPLVIAAAAILIRLLQRQPLSAALSGLVGVLVCVAAVMFTGEGSSYFVPGFYINAAWIVAHSVSLLVGWPLIGLLLGFLRGSLTEWRRVAALRRAAQVVTVFWILVFAARLAVQLPLYLASLPPGADPSAVDALGIARLVMGVPLFALAVIFTWLVLARVSSFVDAAKNNTEVGGSDDTPVSQQEERSSDE